MSFYYSRIIEPFSRPYCRKAGRQMARHALCFVTVSLSTFIYAFCGTGNTITG